MENEFQKLATKEDLANIKWVFAFWVTLALMIIGLYLKKSGHSKPFPKQFSF